jgi:hypothetical protein
MEKAVTADVKAQTEARFKELGAASALVIVCSAQFVLQLDFSIVNVASPAIQRGLHMAPSRLHWIVTGYALTFGSLLLAGGRIADRPTWSTMAPRSRHSSVRDRIRRMRAIAVAAHVDHRSLALRNCRGDGVASSTVAPHDDEPRRTGASRCVPGNDCSWSNDGNRGGGHLDAVPRPASHIPGESTDYRADTRLRPMPPTEQIGGLRARGRVRCRFLLLARLLRLYSDSVTDNSTGSTPW